MEGRSGVLGQNLKAMQVASWKGQKWSSGAETTYTGNYTVIRFVSTSAKFATCTVESVNVFSFLASTSDYNSHETDNSVAGGGQEWSHGAESYARN